MGFALLVGSMVERDARAYDDDAIGDSRLALSRRVFRRRRRAAGLRLRACRP